MEAYKAKLSEAITRTRNWDVECRGTAMMNTFLSQEIGDMGKPSSSALAEISRQIPVAPLDRAGDCAGIHVGAATRFLIENLPLQPVLTIGDVQVEGRSRYQVTRQGLRRMLRKGPSSTDTIFLHVWLTWPDCTILDLTILPAMLHEAGEEPSLDREDSLALVGRPGELDLDLIYVPMLVGEAFLWRIGAVTQMGVARFEMAMTEWIRGMGERLQRR